MTSACGVDSRAFPKSLQRLTIVDELERHWPVALGLALAQQRNRGLQLVLALARDSDGVALNLGLQLGQAVADELADLASEVLVQALAQRRRLPDSPFRSLLDLAIVEDLGRQRPLDRLLQQDVTDGVEGHLTRTVQLDALCFQFDGRSRVFEVIAGVHLAQRLVDSVD